MTIKCWKKTSQQCSVVHIHIEVTYCSDAESTQSNKAQDGAVKACFFPVLIQLLGMCNVIFHFFAAASQNVTITGKQAAHLINKP